MDMCILVQRLRCGWQFCFVLVPLVNFGCCEVLSMSTETVRENIYAQIQLLYVYSTTLHIANKHYQSKKKMLIWHEGWDRTHSGARICTLLRFTMMTQYATNLATLLYNKE